MRKMAVKHLGQQDNGNCIRDIELDVGFSKNTTDIYVQSKHAMDADV